MKSIVKTIVYYDLVLYEVREVKDDADLMSDLKEKNFQIAEKLKSIYGIAKFGMRAVAGSAPPTEEPTK